MRTRFGMAAMWFATTVAACSGGGGTDPTIAFHGQQEVFPGLMHDTGYQPADSPVQLRFTASAMGANTIDARATAGGSRSAPSLTGNRATGHMALDVHILMHTTIKIDVSALGHHFTYEGPLMMVPDLDFHGTGATTFDPFLIDGNAPVTADVPEMALPPIDLMLATGIPGTLTLYLSGTVHSAFTGTCAAIDTDGTAQYRGRVATDGTVHVRAEVTLSVPGFSRTLPSVTVPVEIPTTTHAVDLGTVAVTTYDSHAAADAGGSAAMVGRCPDSTLDAGTDMDAVADGGGSDGDDLATVTDAPVDGAIDDGDGATCGSADAGCSGDGDCCTGTRCIAGHCAVPAPCNATTCAAGCCSATGECLGGTSLDACGVGGAGCAICRGGEECGTHGCQNIVDYSRYGVYVMSATVPSTNSGGSAWDPFGGDPDPYVVVTQASMMGMTSIAADTLSPTWSMAYQITTTGAELRRTGLIFTAYDDDPTSADDTIGMCTVNGSALESAFAGGPRFATCSPSGLQVAYRLDVQ